MRSDVGAQNAPPARSSLQKIHSFFARPGIRSITGPTVPMLARGSAKFSAGEVQTALPNPPASRAIRRVPRPSHPSVQHGLRGAQQYSDQRNQQGQRPATVAYMPNPSVPAAKPTAPSRGQSHFPPHGATTNAAGIIPSPRTGTPAAQFTSHPTGAVNATSNRGPYQHQLPRSTPGQLPDGNSRQHLPNTPQRRKLFNHKTPHSAATTYNVNPIRSPRQVGVEGVCSGAIMKEDTMCESLDCIDLVSPPGHNIPEEIEECPDTQVFKGHAIVSRGDQARDNKRQTGTAASMAPPNNGRPVAHSERSFAVHLQSELSGINGLRDNATTDNDDQLFADFDIDSIIAERANPSAHTGHAAELPSAQLGNEHVMRDPTMSIQHGVPERIRGNGAEKETRSEIASLKRRIAASHEALYHNANAMTMAVDAPAVELYMKRRHEQQLKLDELNAKLRGLESGTSLSTPAAKAQMNVQAKSFSPVTPETAMAQAGTGAVPGPVPFSSDHVYPVNTQRTPSVPPPSGQFARTSNGNNINITNNFFPAQPQLQSAVGSGTALERDIDVRGAPPMNVALPHDSITHDGQDPSYQHGFQQVRPDHLHVNLDILDPRAGTEVMPEAQTELADDEEHPMAFTPTKAPEKGTLRVLQGSQYNAPSSDEEDARKWRDNDRHTFPWSMQLAMENRNIFGNSGFRQNQREAMNAALSGKNVFILMPTGGGKSLCYQLPSLLQEGVTVVISPLVSLIQDQVDHLWSKQIPCGALTSGTPTRVRNELMKDLHNSAPMSKLIYVTPEKITRSPAFFNVLSSLCKRNLLQRFVIDEAHCVSQWGHDFRPDYKQLAIFKEKFPQVPIMALTATATPEVREDVKVQLRISRDCVMFKQSFNRSNLAYEVRKKKKDVVDEIAREINTIHQGEVGIIYCYSQRDCVQVADVLSRKHHLRALPYHAGLSDEIRRANQSEWSTGNVQIICSTLAFGMGIDKANVRFVYHHTMPKNIEGYYQESGRAGRDGQISRCVLYFSMADRMKVLNMILQDAPGGNPYRGGLRRGRGRRESFGTSRNSAATPMNEGQVLRNTQGLAKMTSYCLNDIECRRSLLLAHFDEQFDSSQCDPKCDNCKNTSGVVCNVDVTHHGLAVAEVVEACQSVGRYVSGQTAAYVVEFYMGRRSRVKNADHLSHQHFGGAKGLLKDNEIYRIIEELCSLKVLRVTCDINAYGVVQSQVLLNGDRRPLASLERGQTRIVLKSRNKPEKSNGRTKRPNQDVETGSRAAKRPRTAEAVPAAAGNAADPVPAVTYTSPFFRRISTGTSTAPIPGQHKAPLNDAEASSSPLRKQAPSGALVIDDDDDVLIVPNRVQAPPVSRAPSVRPPPKPRARKKRK